MVDTESPVTTQSFPCSRAVDIHIHLFSGDIEVQLTETDLITVDVSLAAQTPDGDGIPPHDPSASAQALAGVTTRFDHGRLVVLGPRKRAARVPVRIVVRAPSDSRLLCTANSARYAVSGRAGELVVKWTAGELDAELVAGACKVRAGRGRVHLGAGRGQLDITVGTADVDVDHIGGRSRLTTGTGAVRIGTVEADLSVTTGTRGVVIADAVAGDLRVRTGLGPVTIGVRPGVTARVDLVSRSGSARSELPVSRTPPAADHAPRGDVPLRINAASSTGDIVVRPAA
jgi:hypothetical protein